MVGQELWGAQNLQKSIRQGFYAQEADVWKRERYVLCGPRKRPVTVVES